MTSGFSGRYQSRLFNFVHQQSRLVTEKWERTFRHLQVATKWSVEALIYPVYLLFNFAAESVGTQLHGKEVQTRLQLQPNHTDFHNETPPAADTSIQQVLQAVNNLPSEEEDTITRRKSNSVLAFLRSLWRKPITHKPSKPQENTLKCHHQMVQGMATQLSNRHLVLVTAENEILDILTSVQQEKLQNRIIVEVANYWRYWRLAEVKTQIKLLPEIDRFLTKLTSGNVLPQGTTGQEIEQKFLLNRDQALELLDTVVAKLESNALVPVSAAKLAVQKRSWQMLHVAQTQFNIFIFGKQQQNASEKPAVGSEFFADHTFRIQALMWAAIDYFFGTRSEKTLEPTQTLAFRTNSQNHPNNLATDSWLQFGDLFGTSKIVAHEPQLVKSSPSNLISHHQKLVRQPKPNSRLVQPKKTIRNLTSTQKTSASKVSDSRISQQRHKTTQVEAKPDWIETKAHAVEYEKHPLEQILEWLDNAMLWLEKLMVSLFQRMQRLWRGK